MGSSVRVAAGNAHAASRNPTSAHGPGEGTTLSDELPVSALG
jgi:hypothetical protein